MKCASDHTVGDHTRSYSVMQKTGTGESRRRAPKDVLDIRVGTRLVSEPIEAD